MNHEVRNNPCPTNYDEQKTPQTTAIVTVNYNTCKLILQLIWSLYHTIQSKNFAKIVVVDNNSSDGSQDFLRALAKENLIDYRENSENLYHGPALNQAFDYLSMTQKKSPTGNINAVWVLDSDCVVVHPKTLVHALSVMNETHAALVGQRVNDVWNNGKFGLHSLLVDPAKVWRDPISPFEEHGQPSDRLQESCLQAGLPLAPFDFTREGYVIHLGRSTLAAIAQKNEVNNTYFQWAREHSQPHFAGEPTAKGKYEAFLKDFYHAVPNVNLNTVINSIKKQAE